MSSPGKDPMSEFPTQLLRLHVCQHLLITQLEVGLPERISQCLPVTHLGGSLLPAKSRVPGAENREMAEVCE